MSSIVTGNPAVPVAPAPLSENEARLSLLEAAGSLARAGLNHGSAGNLSLRWHRGALDGFLITPSALPYEACTPDDLVWMSIASPTVPGEPVVDGVRRPSSEWRFHHDLHATRPDVQAVVHVHAVHCAALSCLPRVQREGIPAFHYMVAAAGGSDIRCAPYATFGTEALSAHVLQAMQDRRACLLGHHGMIAVGDTLARALALAVEVEWLARSYALALQLGEPELLDAAEMQRVLERFKGYQP